MLSRAEFVAGKVVRGKFVHTIAQRGADRGVTLRDRTVILRDHPLL